MGLSNQGYKQGNKSYDVVNVVQVTYKPKVNLQKAFLTKPMILQVHEHAKQLLTRSLYEVCNPVQ